MWKAKSPPFPGGASSGMPLAVAAASPKDQDEQVDPATRIALRFTRPVRGSEVNGSTVALMGPVGSVEARVTTAEGGCLVFVQPYALLFSGAN
ncbi:hypothetical protein [Xanthomonas sp. MUS 060]|uniref:hypothetical protein n=1 Tax=Xanthomonas sp. MUS 060 TaxID=1588031 RepID=UPI00126A2DB8|nr:hypothetical protein [Xanthomonas sp. MUS 060]